MCTQLALNISHKDVGDSVALHPALLWGHRIASLSFPGRERNQEVPRHRLVQAWQGLWSGDTVHCTLSCGSKDEGHNKC